MTDTSQITEGEVAEAALVSDAELAQMLAELEMAEGASQRGKPLEVELVRHLEPGDLADLLPTAQAERGQGQESPQGSSLISRIRHSHHQIARLFAEGKRAVEISALLGYSPSWLSSLQRDPAFRELLAYYAEQQEEILADALQRQNNLGLAALEELQERLDTDPESFANRELMELIEANVNKPAARVSSFGTGQVAPPAINISFVTPQPSALPPSGGALVIEAETIREAAE